MAAMTPERWKRVEPLYHAARTRPPGERTAFLLEACGDDAELRRDLESLLNENVSEEGFLDTPAAERAVPFLDGNTGRSSMIGRRLGGYLLETLIGVGGMGEVYGARDTKLVRDVAIKILPQEFTRHPDRLARLAREARMLAALNHPNICAIYGLEEDEGNRFLILELVGGATLAQRLANVAGQRNQQRGLDVSETLTIARQIALALEFAHDKGIIHRDLKPANIKITPEGVVKVLDFGLAKAVAGDGSNPDLSVAPTHTGGLTGAAVVGTPAYMSPEQACGRPVDRRTDVWAFGAVLFEMLTGRGPFAGDSVSETLASVLKTEPDWSALPKALPTDLRRLLGRCLVKDSKRRVQSMADVRAQIDDLLNGSASDITGRSDGARKRRWLMAAGGGIVALSLAGAVVAWLSRNGTAAATIDDLFAGGTVRPITEFEGANLDASISPDGNFVTFLADRGGAFHVWLKRIGAGTATDLTPGQPDQRNTGPVRSAGFSGDGSEIWINGSIAARRRLQLVPLLGGNPALFLSERAVNVAWSPDATQLVYFTSEDGDPLYVADAGGGNARVLYRGTNGDHNHFPAWSLDGRWIYFTCAVQSVSEFAVCRVPSSGHSDHAARLISSTSDVRYLTPLDSRTIVFIARDQDRSGPWLWAFDVERQAAHRVSSGLDLERYLSVASSADGRRLVVTIAKSSASLWSVPIVNRVSSERDVTAYPAPGLRSSAPRFAGTTLFYLAPGGAGDGLWKRQGDGPAVEVWKAANGALLEAPSVSPSGDRVAVVIRTQAKLHISIVRADSTNPQSVAEGIDVRGTSAWSPDEEWIVTGGSDANGPGLFKIKVPDGAYDRLRTGQALNPVWSPDGTTIVYEGEQSAVAPLMAVRPDGTDFENFPVISVPSGGQGRSRFLANGHLVYLAGPAGTQDFFDLDLTTRKSRLISHLQSPAVVNAFDITPDGRRIVFDRLRESSEIRVIDLPKK